MELIVSELPSPALEHQRFEVVERRGRGHPDSICDTLAEQCRIALSQHYQDRFGTLLPHSLDNVILSGGASSPRFGDGQVLEPIEIYLAGRAIGAFQGESIPVDEIAVDTSERWLQDHLRALDPAAHVKIHSLVRSGPGAIPGIPSARPREDTIWLANNTSCGVGYAPLSELETIVYRVERFLNLPATKDRHPEVGEDIKVMGIRRSRHISLRLEVAFIGRSVHDIHEYTEKKVRIAELARQTAQRYSEAKVSVEVNAADDLPSQRVYLTVTGTSAEAGNDGQTGQGNRANGLIAPHRSMNLGLSAGKDPIIGARRLYNVAARAIAQSIVEQIPGVNEAAVSLVSRAGQSVTEPEIGEVKIRTPRPLTEVSARIEAIARARVDEMGALARDVYTGRLALERWSLRWLSALPGGRDRERTSDRAEMVRTIEREAHDTAGWTGRTTFRTEVLAAVGRVPRHRFVAPGEASVAYVNGPLPIGYGQTISQPYIVALMTDLAQVEPDHVVLEVGTGSGYQAAVLAEIVEQLFTVELVPELAERAQRCLRELGYRNIELRIGDGYAGWAEHAPFDAIVVTAAASHIPPALVAQLRRGGRLVIPVATGAYGQELKLVSKDQQGQVQERSILPVSFVPLRHEH